MTYKRSRTDVTVRSLVFKPIAINSDTSGVFHKKNGHVSNSDTNETSVGENVAR